MIKTTNVVAAVLLFSAVFSFLFVGYTNGINFAIAQTANTSEPAPETIQEFDKEIGDNNSAIIGNDTNISNPNNTVLDATDVNIEEDCMVLKDGSNYCP
jgi:ABC-type Zn uptake system ZnuABC Zn-binding protein ZnuA